MKIRLIAAAAALLALAGCSTGPTKMIAVGGDRAGGTIDMVYNKTLFDPGADYIEGQVIASEKCRAWGYKGAEAFGGEHVQCRDRNCFDTVVSVTYQCLIK